MKKLISIFLCTTCISTGAIAQPRARIGNLEFIVRKTERDSVIQVFAEEDPCPPCPSENETRPKPKNTYKYHTSEGFGGIGFILPDNGSGYYTTLGGNSINIDAGWIHRYQISRRFALGGTLQYSYYNYKLRDAASEPKFVEEVTGISFDRQALNKQVFRSHNIAAGTFIRLYAVPPRHRGNDGMFIDLGVQGDYAFSKYFKIKMRSGGKDKFREGYAFNPFTASAIARIGWNRKAIFARYRFTDAFNSKALQMDLPPITIGIQFF